MSGVAASFKKKKTEAHRPLGLPLAHRDATRVSAPDPAGRLHRGLVQHRTCPGVPVEVVVFFSSRRRHTRYWRGWSSDVCSSDLILCLISAGQIALLNPLILYRLN